MEKAIFSGGCFWCSEAVFQQLKGVEKITSGYTGGTVKNPTYQEVCAETTGHTEAIEIVFNENEVSFNTLLEIFFATHDPTTLNRQGADVGTQYRSGIFYTSALQKKQAETFIETLTENKLFNAPIVTEITNFNAFYEAEKSHQDYYNQNPKQQYCDFTITPKIEKIKKLFSDKLK